MSNTKTVMGQASNQYVVPLDITDVFSTYLYDGNESTQTITNDIDLDGEGGMAWVKARTNGTYDHYIMDTERGVLKYLKPNGTSAQASSSNAITSFNSNGFTIGGGGQLNNGGDDYASWTFRKAPKFFDVVTYTGDYTVGRTVAHNLGVAPAVIIVRSLSETRNWFVYHRSLGATKHLHINTTDAEATQTDIWNDTEPTDTHFTIGDSSDVNNGGGGGQPYVAYLFAHNDGDGEFGPDGDQDIIKCGSFTTDGSGNATTELGWEPQWLLYKVVDDTNNWIIEDVMRGMPVGGEERYLVPNSSAAEAGYDGTSLTPTGFKSFLTANKTYIYIAIRRGPLAPPESGTEVFDVATYIGTASSLTPQSLEAADLGFQKTRNAAGSPAPRWYDRLRGSGVYLRSSSTSGETGTNPAIYNFNASQVIEVDSLESTSGDSYVSYNWKRAPKFFDVVAYEGTSNPSAVFNHNLGVIPEMSIIKNRDGNTNWKVYHKGYPTGSGGHLNSSIATDTGTTINNLTENTFTVNVAGIETNTSGYSYIAYLFASLDGISKVGSYTGDGTNDGSYVIDCGFTAGARFILIKRTDSATDWFVFDTERGIVAGGDDPNLRINTTYAENLANDVEPNPSGFALKAALNQSGGEYIFYAIA